VEGGTEIRLYDPRRNPQDWTDLVRPTECAVFLKDGSTSTPLASDGRPFSDPAGITCMVFESMDAAQRFCEAKVEALPHLRCEIYDARGLSHPPLLVIAHPDQQRNDESGSGSSRRRKVVAGGVLLTAAPLFWMGWSKSSDLAIFLAINCVFVAVRLVYWDFGVKHRERERLRRLEQHRRMERGDA
jgi:hypothetical protein